MCRDGGYGKDKPEDVQAVGLRVERHSENRTFRASHIQESLCQASADPAGSSSCNSAPAIWASSLFRRRHFGGILLTY